MIHIAPKSPTIADKRRIDFAWVLDCRRGRQRSALRTRVGTAASKLQRAFSATQQDSAARSDANASARSSPDASPGVGRAPVVVNAQSAARSLFTALNHRDVSAVLSLLADDVTYENLGSSAVLRGRAAVGRFYLEALAALPEDAMFVLEGSAGQGTDPWVGDAAGGPVLQAGVAWRVQLNGMEVPLSRGVGVYWADPRTGRLARIWDNPEHTVKQAAPSLSSAAWSSPLLRGLGPLVIPAAASVGSFLTNLGPGGGNGGGGGEAAASNGGGGGGSGLAGSVMSTLSSMMPFQSQGPAAAAAASRGGGGESSSSNGGSGSNPGGGRNTIYRDHTRIQANGGAGVRAFAAAAAASAAATAAGGGGGGVRAGLSAVASKTQLGSSGPRPMRGNGASTSSSSGPAGGGDAPAARGVSASAGGHRINGAALTSATTAATTAAAATTANAAAAVTSSVSAGAGGSAASGLRTAVTAPTSSAAAALAVRVNAGPASAAASATTAVATATAPTASDGVALSSSGEPIRMRPLPAPAAPPPPPETAPQRKATAPPSSGASVSVASSLASLDDGGGDATPAMTPDQASVAGAATTVTADAASPSSQESGPTSNGIRTSPPDAAKSSDIKNSGKDNKSIGGGGSGSGGGGEGGGSVAFGSVDSGSDTDGDGGGGSAALPFVPSASLSANLTGLWEKDLAASQVQAYESMLDVLELGGLQKVTARLIDGLDVRQDDQRFEIGFVTVVPFFRVTEKSRFGGATTMMRRDLRSGRQTAQAARIPGGVCVDMSWEAPLAGSLREEYVASEDGNQMAVTSTIRIGTRSAVATQVYRRSGRNKSDFLASKRSSYGSMEDVLKSQESKYGKINY